MSLTRSHRTTIAIALAVAIVVTAAGDLSGQARDPRPRDATAAILAAFGQFDVVAVSAGHNNEKLDTFLVSLVRNPALPGTVNDLVLECGNSRYQAVLDRYTAGDLVPIEQARPAWQDTTVPICAMSGFYAELYPLVREINRALPAGQRLRVLAGEPAFDWSAPDAVNARRGLDRNASLAEIVSKEVLAKHHKALLLAGVGHSYHGDAAGTTAVNLYQREYPDRTFVIETHAGFGAFIDLDRGHDLETRMRGWPVPSVTPIAGTWLADLDLPYFLWPFPKRMAGEKIANIADAYLYLGPGNSLTWEPTPDSILNDAAYMALLSTRFGITVDGLRQRNADRRFMNTADRADALKFAPGAPLVGTYVSGGETLEVDFRSGVLAAQLPGSTAWVQLAPGDRPTRWAAGQGRLDFTVVDGNGSAVSLDRRDGRPPATFTRRH